MLALALAALALSLAALAPLLWTLRAANSSRGRREAALALHRAQLAELDRDLAEGRLLASEHASAVLEVQRRLLAVAATPDAAGDTPSARAPLIAAAVLLPLAALALYLPGGVPGMPAAPLAPRLADADRQARDAAQVIGELRQKIATLDPASPEARRGFMLLGRAEAERGDMAAAAAAWQSALAVQFDPTLAAMTAEAMTLAQGHMSPEAAGLFRKALATAPADAPWRQMAEKQLQGQP